MFEKYFANFTAYCASPFVYLLPSSPCYFRSDSYYPYFSTLPIYYPVNAFLHFPDNSILGKVEIENISRWILSRTKRIFDAHQQGPSIQYPLTLGICRRISNQSQKSFRIRIVCNIFLPFLIKMYLFSLNICISFHIFAYLRYIYIYIKLKE